MIKSYIISGIRNFLSNKVSSFINVLGLATTVSIAIAVYIIIDRQWHLDQFHSDHQRIYTVQSIIDWNRTEETWARTPQLLGKAMFGEFPQIEQMTRVQIKSALIRYEDKVFAERLHFADKDFFNLFSFPLKSGSAISLADRKSIILGEEEADKYFRNEDPIGKELRVIINEKVHLFTVTGVAEKFPETASFGFDFLLSIENLPSMYEMDINSWNDVNTSSVFTFIKLDHSDNLTHLKANSTKYLDIVNQANPDWPILRFDFEPLTTIARNSQYTRECLACGSTPEVIIMFGIISLILFASACFNYINIAIASSSKRLKEIALRKVIGSSRKRIIFQFLIENLVISFFSVALGLIIAKTIVIPGMNTIFGGDSLELNFLENTRLIYFVLGMFVVVGLGSGAYPAYYISSFKPLDIFRGKERLVGKSRMTKIFLTFQFFLTFVAVVSGLIFTQTNRSQEKQSWGYDQKNLMVVPVKNITQYKVIEQYALETGNISVYCGSRNQIGQSKIEEVVEVDNENSTVDAFHVDANYLNTMGLIIKSGTFFNPKLHGEQSNQIVVNEKLMEKFGWEIGDYETKQIKIGGARFQIIGVVEDFHHYSFFEPVKASIFRIASDDQFRYLTLKVNDGELGKLESEIETLWLKNFPDVPFSGFQQEEVFDLFFQQTGQLINIMNFTSVMAIILSSMGLFGLISLLIVKRMKELSIRNVLGASKADSAKLIAGQFVWMLGFSLILALPVSYFTFDFLLSQMFLGSPSTLNWIPFLIALIIISSTILLTVSYHIRQLMSTNPIDSLRME